MVSGANRMVSGANDLAPAEDVHNENPSLVALGKKVSSEEVDRKGSRMPGI